MALSDEEQHLLDQLEQALVRDDPRLSSLDLERERRRRTGTALIIWTIGLLLVAGGLLIVTRGPLLVGAIVTAVGFVLMWRCAVTLLS